ncbi:MAG: hypothetical protein L6246_08865 [Thermodesulfovibrionales bacterium]|nr:hypothetical protein [Nitrospinota bacterium]MCG2710408.1 hypothetical protein [Thermodesulfovibrionales bacterium]
MQTISIKSSSSEKIIPLLTNALDREKRLIVGSLKKISEKIDSLAKSLSVDIDKLVAGEVEHTEANDMKLVELEGELKILRHLEDELKELESLEICR